MVFNNLFFLFAFLPLAWVAYSLIRNEKAKNIFLLAASLLFYAFGSLTDLCVLLILGAWTFVSGLQLDTEDEKGRQRTFWISAGFLVLVLCFYKYIPYWFSALKLRFPIGISFYTFSAVSYLADVYRRKVPVQKNITAFGLYLAFFGKVNMGPISEYHQLEDQLVSRTVSLKKSGSGALMFVRGLVKKVVFADQIALAYALLANDSSVLGAWLLGLAYTFQLYFDFSGYSDMAIGLGRLFGFDIPANFDHPYTALSVQDFWRRWHIALSSWFRDYVYIPLGGSRAGERAYVRNILIVWVLTGIWHGPNLTYIAWGLYYGALLLFEHYYGKRVLEKVPRPARIVLIFLVANTGWVFFANPSLSSAFSQLGCMIGLGSSGLASQTAFYVLTTFGVLFAGCVLFSSSLFDRIERTTICAKYGNAVWLGIYIAAFLCCVILITASTSHAFLYFAF
ncbi:MBOAT family protein [uncultured Dubosiella sp.]|uniref:MBOAT family O-acyltransferase n=1 Tax=uncultured Dubosiella sp. TaxID=1937011 RepID=UPI0027303740|nr:MBOAT family O-acyltransferase [uncultured Dubosiella sp.]